MTAFFFSELHLTLSSSSSFSFLKIMGYLSGASPHIMSGAVAALSLLIYEDPSLYISVPDLMPSVLILLQSKASEVIKVNMPHLRYYRTVFYIPNYDSH